MPSDPITSCQMDGETVEKVADFILQGLQNHSRWWLQPWNKKTLAPWKKSYDQPRQHIKKQRCYFANKGPSSQGCGFSSGRVRIWELYCEEGWVPKNLNCGIGEDSWESLGLQGDPTSPFWRRSALGVLWKEWCLSWNSSTLATSCEELTHWKIPWC